MWDRMLLRKLIALLLPVLPAPILDGSVTKAIAFSAVQVQWGNFTFPVYAYPTQNPSASVIGGTVYRGYQYENMRGYYLAADYYSGNFYKIIYNTGTSSWVVTRKPWVPFCLSQILAKTRPGALCHEQYSRWSVQGYLRWGS